tara:strand:- start:1124 stop:1786 length:663 start_codon:yes stop_codon:yes gene_type:complete
MTRKPTDPRNYIPKGYHKMPNGGLMRDGDHKGELPGTNKLKNQYNSLLNKAQLYIDGSKIEQYAPKISAKDYQLGVIKRYFIQKANDKNSPIFEISKRTAPKYRENPLYNLAEIDWVISGQEAEKTIGEVTQKLSPEQMNKLSIQSVSKIIPNLFLYLPNLLQYFEGNIGNIKLRSRKTISSTPSVAASSTQSSGVASSSSRGGGSSGGGSSGGGGGGGY